MAKLESGNYSNTLSKKYYNIFSMRSPERRLRINTGTVYLENIDGVNTWWSKYDSYSQAVDDLILLFDHNKFPTKRLSVDQFVSELKNDGYFGISANSYLNGLKKYL